MSVRFALCAKLSLFRHDIISGKCLEMLIWAYWWFKKYSRDQIMMKCQKLSLEFPHQGQYDGTTCACASPETFTDIITAVNQNLSVALYMYSAVSRQPTKKIVQYFRPTHNNKTHFST